LKVLSGRPPSGRDRYVVFDPSAGVFTTGFCGRNGAEFDRIQFVTAKLKPATWRRR
jgi:hypothetical protein